MRLAALSQAESNDLLRYLGTSSLTGKYWVDGVLPAGGTVWQYSNLMPPAFPYTPIYYHTRLVGSGMCLAAKRTTSPAMTGYNNVDCNKSINFICEGAP